MSTALQCPDCGQKHPLGSVGDEVVFPCSRCSRPLKVPAAYRPGANGAGANGTARAAGSRTAAGSGPRGRKRRGSASLSMPVRILLWVVAFALGAMVVRMVAKWTGFVGGDTLVDLLIDHSFGNYFKLFVLVPFWALFSTLFLTLFLEGPDWFRRRRAGEPMGPQSGRTAAGAAAAKRTTRTGATAGARIAGAAAKGGTTGTIPKRVPAAAGAAAAGAAVGATNRPRAIPRRGDAPAEPVAPAARPQPDDRTQALAVAPAAAESELVDEYTEKAAAGHRPRRIPRRDDGS